MSLKDFLLLWSVGVTIFATCMTWAIDGAGVGVSVFAGLSALTALCYWFAEPR